MGRLKTVNWTALDAAQRSTMLQRPALADDREIQAVVADIIARVRADGDAALRQLQLEFGGQQLERLIRCRCSRASAASCAVR